MDGDFCSPLKLLATSQPVPNAIPLGIQDQLQLNGLPNSPVNHEMELDDTDNALIPVKSAVDVCLTQHPGGHVDSDLVKHYGSSHDARGAALQQAQPISDLQGLSDVSEVLAGAFNDGALLPASQEGKPQLQYSSNFVTDLHNKNNNDNKKKYQIFPEHNLLNPQPTSKILVAPNIDSKPSVFSSPCLPMDGNLSPGAGDRLHVQSLQSNSLSNQSKTMWSNSSKLLHHESSVFSHTFQPEKRSFAKVVSPQAVVDTIPAKGTTPECGLLVERQKGSTLNDYAKALELISGKHTLVFIGQSPDDPNYVMAFLDRPSSVEAVVAQGIRIKGIWVCVTNLMQPATKLIISRVLPFISDSLIIDGCRSFGTPVFPNLRRIPASIQSEAFRGVYSFRRELLLVLDRDKTLPDSITVYSHGKFYTLDISLTGLTCFRCKKPGHKVSSCKEPYIQELHGVPSIPLGSSPSSLPNANSNPIPIHGLTEKNARPKTSLPKPSVDFGQVESFNKNQVASSSGVLGAWKLVGKNGKPVSCPLPSQDANIKISKLSDGLDVSSLRQFSQRRESTSSPEGSVAGEAKAQSSVSLSKNTGKRKSRKDKGSGPVSCGKVNSSSQPEPNISQVQISHIKGKENGQHKRKPTEEGRKKENEKIEETNHPSVFKNAKNYGANSKPKKVELDLANSVTSSLLDSLRNLRGARRRAVVVDFESRYPQLSKMVELAMGSLPSSVPGSQLFKTLMIVQQDLKNSVNPDGRRPSRHSE